MILECLHEPALLHMEIYYGSDGKIAEHRF